MDDVAGAATVRAFLIADIRGYTSFTRERGDEEAARLTARFAELTREVVGAGGGRTVELRGDEALCVFDSPRQALRASVALQQRFADAIREDPALPMRVGIGLEAGEAVEAEDGFRGGALNLAARLCALARAGEVLAGDGIVLMAGQVDGLGYEDRGRVRVKGIANPVRVNRLEFALDLPPAASEQRPRRRSRTAAIAAGAALVLLGAGVAAFLVLGGSSEQSGVAGDSAALLDPASGHVRSETAVGATPLDVVSDAAAAWTLDGDAQTISRVSPDGGRALTKAPGFTPTALALGGGELWASYVERGDSGVHLGVAELDPSTLTPRSQRLLPGTGPPFGDNPPILYADGAVLVGGPTDEIRKLDPVSHKVLRAGRLGTPAGALAFGLGSIWATNGRGVLRIDPDTLKVTQPIPLATPDSGPIAVGASSVWVGDPLTGTVWRIQPGPPVQTHTIAAGLSASGITFGDGALWVASAVDGKVFRIDAKTEDVRSFELGNAPVDVSVAPAGVWAAVAAGGGRTIEAAPKLEGLETLPAGTCDTAVHGGSAEPDFLIVSDLPMQLEAPVTLPMVQAIEFVLRQHGFRAGPYNVALQSCDDATVPAASYTEEKCTANAKRYAATLSVIAVIGPYNSGCASAEIPVGNRARPGPLPIVSPTSSYVGLTRSAPGVSPGDPGRNYPTGVRNFARVYPPDDMQGAADAVLAKRLGVRHPYVFLDDPNEGYSATLAPGFAIAAKRLGLDVIGPESPRPRDGFEALAQRLRREGVDGVFIGGLSNDRTAQFIRAMRRGLGPKAVIIAPDAFLPAAEQVRSIGPGAIGMYVSGAVVTRPDDQLPLAGREFVRKFRATQRGRPVDYYAPYAAQAAEVLLDAIARSDGSRASVSRELLRVRLSDGIFGRFAIDKNGDPTENLLPIFRVKRNAPGSLYPDDPVVTVIRAPARLLR